MFEGQRREVNVNTTSDDGVASGVIQFADTHSPLNTTTGELSGLYTARDEIVGGFLNRLDDLAGTLAFEFNKVYSQGQGLVGFDQLTSIDAVTNTDAALDAAGLPFTPVSGTFDLLVHSKDDDLNARRTTIRIDLNGLDEDTSLTSLAQQLDAVDGISASVTSTGQLQISADSTDIEFAFSGDTSGVLAALGLNTFFTGSTAASIGVNDEVKGISNAGKFAASLGGIGEDSRNAERLAAFLDQPLESAGGASLGRFVQPADQRSDARLGGGAIGGRGLSHIRRHAGRPAAGGERREHRRRSGEDDDAAADLSGVGEVHSDDFRIVGFAGEACKSV